MIVDKALHVWGSCDYHVILKYTITVASYILKENVKKGSEGRGSLVGGMGTVDKEVIHWREIALFPVHGVRL